MPTAWALIAVATSPETLLSFTMTKITPRLMVLPVATLAVVAACNASVAAEPSSVKPATSKDAAMARREQELEAVALQILLAPMFNSSAKGLMGTGAAGRHWETMMVEHIARQLARQGGLRLIPRPRQGGGPAGAGAPVGLRQRPALAPCRAGVCRPAPARIGEWQTTVAYADAPDSLEPAPNVKSRNNLERNP